MGNMDKCAETSESALDTPVSAFRGIGEAREAALHKMGIFTAGDLIRTYPRAYQNRGDIKPIGEIKRELNDAAVESEFESAVGTYSAVLTIAAVPVVTMIKRGMTLLKVRGFDETGACEITYFNQPYLRDKLTVGSEFRFFGKFTLDKYGLKVTNPICEAYYEGAPLVGIVPVYPSSASVKQKQISSLISEAMKLCGNEITEYLPSEAREEFHLPTRYSTLVSIHHPESMAALEAAKKRLVFDELYLMFLSIAVDGRRLRRDNTCPMKLKKTDASRFRKSLPFELTGAQSRSIDEIAADMGSEHLMNRILTGDVGSGKTIVAAAAIYIAVKNGYRAALMVPTEILANQHYAGLSELLGKLGIKCALLTGSTRKKERDEILSGLRDSSNFTAQTALPGTSPDRIDVIIGTHALISENTIIDNLGLAVIDEQHRFGVSQRAALFDKAEHTHCLVMSATPIPRTLTLATYGSIDISRIDELPAGRQKIDTFIVNESYRERLNGFIRKQVEAGHQVYVVCPSVDENEENRIDYSDPDELSNLSLDSIDYDDGYSQMNDCSVPIKAATTHAKYLAEALPDLSVGFVHGKLKASEKEAVMQAFVDGRLNVLVSTTVIEVGVNVPNATLMIVENAERFGLSQLHQLRGRVGRGSAKSYFILVSDTRNEQSRERLNIIKTTTDGFKIAESDLEMRGPGDFIGESGAIKQHGQMNFRLAATCRDTEMIERASFYARQTAGEDPELSSAQNRRAARQLKYYTEHTDSIKN